MPRTLLTLYIIILLCVLMVPLDYATSINFELQNAPPSFKHLFGTDDLGRDVLYRCFYALKISLIVGFAAVCIDMVLGAIIGVLSALLPAPYGQLMGRFLDIMTILPQMLLSILLLTVIKNSFYSLILAISLTGWLPTARALRAELLKLKKMDFVTSLKGFGFSSKTILLHHLLPLSLPTLIVSSALCLPAAIFSEAFMSFLGLGVMPPTPSLGNMIADALPALSYYPWRLLFPSALVFLLIFSLLQGIESLKKKLCEAL